MSFFLFDNFDKYGNWPTKLIDICQKFYDKFEKYPNYIRMNEKTLDALFDEAEEAFKNPYSEEHAVRDSKGEILIPINMTTDNDYQIPENLKPEDEEFLENYMETNAFEEDKDLDVIYPMSFGINNDCTVSFITNKFELKFIDGEKLPEKCFIIQFGSGPEDGGEDFEIEETEDNMQIFQLAA